MSLTQQSDKKKYGPFRVLVGAHIESHPEASNHPDGRPRDIVYNAGDEFYSDADLTTLNAPGMAPKFAKVSFSNLASATVNSTAKRADETPAQYAARMKLLAEEATKLANGDEPVIVSGNQTVASTKKASPETASNSDVYKRLESLKAEDIKGWLEGEEIDPGSAKSKDELLKVARKALKV